MKQIETTGVTIDKAVEKALKELACAKEDVEITVINKGSRGLFGLGASEAKVLVKVIKEEEIKEVVKAPVKAAVSQTAKTVEPAKTEYKKAFSEMKPSSDIVCQNYLSDVLAHMGINAEIEANKKEDELDLEISGELMGVVIGRRGDTLDALQYLCSIVHNKGREEYERVNLDTENYRAKREETLINLAKKIANTVLKTGRSITLEPMNPNERRIIHSTLQEYSAISTYSIGEDPNRKIVVNSKNAQRRRSGYKKDFSSSYKKPYSQPTEEIQAPSSEE